MGNKAGQDRTNPVISLSSALFGPSETTTLENRVFNAVMLMLSVMSLFTVASDISLKLPLRHLLLSGTALIISLSLYVFSIKTKKYEKYVLPATIFFLAIVVSGWFGDNGISGSTGYYFFVLVLMVSTVLKGRVRNVMMAIVFFAIAVLIGIEICCPGLYIQIDVSRNQMILDTGKSLFLCLAVVAVMLGIILKQLAQDREKLKKASEEIKDLRTILPICAVCKKIRDDKGYWNRVEAYISSRHAVEFTHGICPECLEREREKRRS